MGLATRRHETCQFRKRATSAPAEGPAHGLDFARHVNFTSELCGRRSGVFTEEARFGAACILLERCLL